MSSSSGQQIFVELFSMRALDAQYIFKTDKNTLGFKGNQWIWNMQESSIEVTDQPQSN